MNDAGGPISTYRMRGSQPRPILGGRSPRSLWRAPIILVLVMFGWALLVFALAAFAAPNDANVEAPIEVGRGVVVVPADGWYSAGEVWDVGPDAISLQNSGAYVAFYVEEYSGTKEDLLNEILESIEPDFENLRVLPSAEITVAGELPGLAAMFTGVSEYWGPENELVVATHAGLGVVMLATAPAGQLAHLQADLDVMLDTLTVPQ